MYVSSGVLVQTHIAKQFDARTKIWTNHEVGHLA